MRKRISIAFVLLAWLAGSAFTLLGQTASSPAAQASGNTPPQQKSLQKPITKPAQGQDTAEDSVEQVPITTLEFKPGGTVPGVKGSPAYTNPVLCSADGIPYVSFLDIGNLGMQTVTSLDPKGGHVFSAQAAQGLYDINNIQAYFVAQSFVGLLVNATKDSTKSSQTINLGKGIPPRAVYTGEHHDFLVEFSLDGNFKTAVELPDSFHFWRITALPDDSILVLGYDRINARPHLVILDSGGEIKRTLQIPAQMDEDPVLAQGQAQEDMVKQSLAESSLSWWLFASARQKTLMYQAHKNVPILEVGAGGVVREVTIEHPKGYAIETILPSNDRWLIRYRKEGLADSGEIDLSPKARNYVLYEVDAADGSLKRRIEIADGQFYSATCEKDGAVTAFTIDQDKINLLSADLGR